MIPFTGTFLLATGVHHQGCHGIIHVGWLLCQPLDEGLPVYCASHGYNPNVVGPSPWIKIILVTYSVSGLFK